MASHVRYGRLAAVSLSGAVTLVALLGSVGVLPSSNAEPPTPRAHLSAAVTQPQAHTATPPSRATTPKPATTKTSGERGRTTSRKQPTKATPPAAKTPQPLPADSGDGRRVVFSQSLQRVWLVGTNNNVVAQYPVSGSLTDNLHPGTYAVDGKSMHAIGVDDSGTMTHFVSFTQGPTGAAIGFHDIPVKDGKKIQSWKQLGTPQSHGCIRQTHADSIKLWNFTSLGSTVVVVA